MAAFPFNEEKAINVILYILDKIGGKCDMHKLCKILYFSDQKHLVKYGRPVIGDVYFAMNAGPVPSSVYDGFKAIDNPGRYCFPLFSKNLQKHRYVISSSVKPDLGELSKSDLRFLDEAIKENKNLSFEDLKKKSHQFAWKNATRDGVMSIVNIAKEANCDNDMINYIKENMYLFAASL